MKNWKSTVIGQKFAASFSGGKDSTLALYKAMADGTAVALISMMREEDGLAGAHGVSVQILKAQAKSMGLPLITYSTDWESYGSNLIKAIHDAKDLGAQVLVTGDIDLPEHNCWNETITKQAGVSLSVPLWQMDRHKAVEEFLSLGFVSKIVAINPSRGMKESDLGRILSPELIEELDARGIDCCGEAGEFHTIVLDGPNFQFPIKVKEGTIHTIGKNLCLPLEVIE